ncbi:hypothetical protein VSR34_01185 [Paraburkholderia sp. JHI2823]|uniref:hypothetical protein n=1 Tax=Paraburkholderia sp. JHI2823 TaxID=3112960 RepID=UPI00317AEE4B
MDIHGLPFRSPHPAWQPTLKSAVRAEDQIDCSLTGNLSNEVTPSLAEGPTAHVNDCSVHTRAAYVMSGYLKRDAIHVLFDEAKRDANFETSIGDYSIHGHALRDSENGDDLAKILEAAQFDLAADGELTALERSLESCVRTTKRSIRATWIRLNAGDGRKFLVCDRLNNVVLEAANRTRPAFDCCSHLPAIECVKARFHRSFNVRIGHGDLQGNEEIQACQ